MRIRTWIKKDRGKRGRDNFSPIVTEVVGALNDSWMTELKGARDSKGTEWTRSPH